MINILLPIAGKSMFFESQEYPFPKPLIEIFGTSMIQMVVENLATIAGNTQFVFVVNSADCRKYHIDDVLDLLTDNSCITVKLGGETKGAACSALMAIDHIDNDTPLIIANSDQIIEEDLNAIIGHFNDKGADAGVACFETIHPRWSYARIDDAGNVVETSEKRPISKNAIAGFYYFRHGSDFVRAAKKSIEKDNSIDGIFFIAPTLNELILEGKKLRTFRIANDKYHTFYSPQKIKEFEKKKAGGYGYE